MTAPITLTQLHQMKSRGEKIVALTAYDYPFAKMADDCGVHIILVGDSLGMVVQGRTTTLPVTMDEMVYHTRIVSNAVSKAMVIERIIQDTGVPGAQIVGFGDGYVEIEEIRRVGGVAVGVASDETNPHQLNPTKRERLIRAGADVIVPHYIPLAPLMEALGM